MSTADARHASGRTRWALVARGCVALAIGIVILVRPLDAVAGLAQMIAAWALVNGACDLVHAFALRPLSYWWVLLLSGLVAIGFGVASVIGYPALPLAWAGPWVAFAMLSTGVTAIGLARQRRQLRGERRGGLWPMALGLASIVAAAAAAGYQATTLMALVRLIAAFGIVSGILLLIGAAWLHGVARASRGTATRAE